MQAIMLVSPWISIDLSKTSYLHKHGLAKYSLLPSRCTWPVLDFLRLHPGAGQSSRSTHKIVASRLHPPPLQAITIHSTIT